MTDQISRDDLNNYIEQLERRLGEAVNASITCSQTAISAYYACTKQLPILQYYGNLPPTLPEAVMEKAQLLPNREAIIARLPKGGRGLEIGTQRGNFAKHMLQVAEPEQLHLVDITYDLFDKPWFDNYISSSQVILHEGVSWSIVNDFEQDSFDWIYIDAGHDYESVTKDIVASWDKVKPGGYLIFNDFTSWSPLEMIPYGVMQAVCEFQLGHAEDFSIAWFAFHPQGYHDIALRREK
ncbi:class I SAM-dependent methyltransferase [Sphingomonas sp. CV7422]|uniref:class I SAM-dependent methyltransferase n=1 Tax=Sphingomonas sp. CV7422 TaxID=3018036 RepID=UPI0022FEC062|nr:class I SAM-dependent methyltransferase [Sphingomonas sp. CV7422]